MKRVLLALGALAALLLALRIGVGHSPWKAPPGNGFPVGEAVAPRRVLPANAAAVDLCLALLEPERVVALPEAAVGYSRLDQAEAPWKELPRFSGFDAETLLSFRPDLVIAHAWQSPETIATVRQSGVRVLVLALPETWEDVRQGLLACGRALGTEERARTELDELDRRVSDLVAGAPPPEQRLRALSYVNLGTGGWAAGAGTTADILFGLAGLRNAAADAGLRGHATVDLEALLGMDPDLFVVGAEQDLRDGVARVPPTEAYLRAEPSLAGLRALREGRIVRLPARLFTTSSIELVAGAELLARRIAELP